WRHKYSGKVRDLYVPDDGAQDLILVVASDRIIAYDHVLPTPIPDKGAVLTALSLWWFEQLSPLVPNHVVSLDVPEQVAGRAMVCRTGDVPGGVRGSRIPDRLRVGGVPGHRRRLRGRTARGTTGGRPAPRADLHPGDQGRGGRAR